MRRELFGDRLLQIRIGANVETLLPESDPDKTEIRKRLADLGIQDGECFIHPVDNTLCRLLIEAEPLWSEAGAATARAKSVIARLKDAGSEGLNPADYPAPDSVES